MNVVLALAVVLIIAIVVGIALIWALCEIAKLSDQVMSDLEAENDDLD